MFLSYYWSKLEHLLGHPFAMAEHISLALFPFFWSCSVTPDFQTAPPCPTPPLSTIVCLSICLPCILLVKASLRSYFLEWSFLLGQFQDGKFVFGGERLDQIDRKSFRSIQETWSLHLLPFLRSSQRFPKSGYNDGFSLPTWLVLLAQVLKSWNKSVFKIHLRKSNRKSDIL